MNNNKFKCCMGSQLFYLSIYTKHPLKYGKNQADNLGFKDFGADFFPFFIGV